MNTKKETNYKKWAFLLLIFLIVKDIGTYYYIYLDATRGGFSSTDRFIQNLNIIGVIGYVTILAGIIALILSFKNKEKKNYQFYISAIGYPIIIIQTILVLIERF